MKASAKFPRKKKKRLPLLRCIDAPEKSQPKWGAESLKKLAELLPVGSEVTLNGDKTDLYHRTVAEIINKSKINVNKKMVEIGYAVFYPFQKGCSEYAELEKVARKSLLGVWSDSKFQAPWDYRAQNVLLEDFFILWIYLFIYSEKIFFAL